MDVSLGKYRNPGNKRSPNCDTDRLSRNKVIPTCVRHKEGRERVEDTKSGNNQYHAKRCQSH